MKQTIYTHGLIKSSLESRVHWKTKSSLEITGRVIKSSLENWARYCALNRRPGKIVVKKKQLHFQTLITAENKSINKSFFETFNLSTGKKSGSKPNLTVEQIHEFSQFFTSVAEKLIEKGNGK